MPFNRSLREPKSFPCWLTMGKVFLVLVYPLGRYMKPLADFQHREIAFSKRLSLCFHSSTGWNIHSRIGKGLELRERT